MIPAPANEPQPLPRLRDDLELVDTRNATSGSATRTIYDPLRHRFIRVDRGTFELMSILNECRDGHDLRQKAWNAFSQDIDDQALTSLTEFLERSELTDHALDGDWKTLASRGAKARTRLASRAIHNYIFFKVPLFRPQRFLSSTIAFARPFMSHTAAAIVILTGCVGLYLVSRQWDAFLNTFHHAFSWQGAATFAIALVFVKTLHELAYAYVAVSYGCRVSSLGVAFMLLTPLLYTDVTDAWRLKNNRHRLQIDAAGIILELSLAAIATFLWAFLPEGIPKSIAFAVATVGWVMSLAFNLNPFMRFDGYYILSDYLNVENLQPRAFALARWHLRETLFDLRAPAPEVFERRLHWTLIIYAWATWVYRLVLFIGIALLVYVLFFKVLGVILFVIEIAVFVARPIWNEFKEWHAMRNTIVKRTRTMISVAILCGLVAVLAVPWSKRVEVPAILGSSDVKQIFPPRPARVKQVNKRQGDPVFVGEVIVKLHAPELSSRINLAIVQKQKIQLRLSRRTADETDRAESLVLERELVSLKTRIAGLKKERAELTIRAPVSGMVIEINPHLHQGRWIAGRERIALVGSRATWTLKGYISETDIERIEPGATGTFIPDDPMLQSRDVTLTSVLRAGTSVVEQLELASIYGGPVATRPDADGSVVPVSAQFLATMDTKSNGKPLPHTVRGIVHLTGTPQSLLARVWRQILSVLVRESGV